MTRSFPIGAGIATVVVALALGTPGALAQDPAPSVSVQISGDPFVGSRLTAEVTYSGTGELEYRWRRCDAEAVVFDDDQCRSIRDAKQSTYVVTEADVGYRLTVRVELEVEGDDDDDVVVSDTAEPTAVVTLTPQPSAEPTPQPSPAPSPQPSPEPSPEPAGSQLLPTPTTSVGEVQPILYLRPFPVVRIRGVIARRGALVTLLRVTSGERTRVDVRCSGDGCPVERVTRVGPGRIRQLERHLPAGIRITIRVSRPGYIGKYVRLRIRANRAPARTDACVVSTARRPATCPAP